MSVIKAFLLPPGLFVVLFAAAFLLPRKSGSLRMTAATGTTILLYLCSTPFVGGNLLRTLETVPAVDAKELVANGVQAIFVLGAGVHRYAPEYGTDATADALLLERLRYAARLHRISGLPVFVSGGAVRGREERVADVMARVLKEDFGIDIAGEETESSTTFENGVFSSKLLRDRGIDKVALVTHAWHMPRALASFRAAGINVVPAATGFTEPIGLTPDQCLPSVRALARTYYAMHEWLGIVWYRLSKFGWSANSANASVAYSFYFRHPGA